MPRISAANYQKPSAYLTRPIDASDASRRSGKTGLLRCDRTSRLGCGGVAKRSRGGPQERRFWRCRPLAVAWNNGRRRGAR